MDLIEDDKIFLPLSQYINTFLTVRDFENKNDETASPSFDMRANDPFLIPIDAKYQKQIYNSNYLKLITKIIINIKIPEPCIDIFRSKLDDELLTLFIIALKNDLKLVTIEEDTYGYKINCTIMISDLIMPVISRFNSEFMSTFKHMSSLLEAAKGNPNCFYLNAKGSTPVSQYICMFVAKELKIPDTPWGNSKI